jgi:hypothetical protein
MAARAGGARRGCEEKMTNKKNDRAGDTEGGSRRRGGRGRGRRNEAEGEGVATATERSPQPARAANGAVRVEREIGGRRLILETGRMAKLADGACLAIYGDTVVLATAQSSKEREDIDFFPLTVEYREKPAAAGKFPGGFFKREGRPTTKEILGSRVIDRSIRPCSRRDSAARSRS